MKKLLIAGLLVAASSTWAQTTAPVQNLSSKAKAALAMATCDTCGKVESVTQVKRKGKGGALGKIGGAVAGGLLGNQIGKGTGNTVATVGGAVGGAVIGNEVQKRVSSKKVWVTKVKMKDGTVATFEQDAQPVWVSGNVVKVEGTTPTRQ